MIKLRLLALGLLWMKIAGAQLYFPPLTTNAWDTISPKTLGWCVDRTDSLYKLLEQNKTKAFIILKDGKIVVEKYFGTFTADSAWYWASAGKTITATLIGIAQQQGLLNINDISSKYLGKGWTSCPPEKEDLIRIKHQLTMTTGLDYLVPDWDCSDSACLKYKADAGTQWFYHNATYLLLQNVLEAASGKTLQQYTSQQLGVKMGLSGLWYDGVFYSKPRAMARFGLLMLNQGIWNGDTILKDRSYYTAMMNTSQSLNESYGYLWWLNGKNSFKLPASTQTYFGPLCKQAPVDMVSGLGKNDQKVYVIPSNNLVIVRMGEAALDNSPVPVIFDTLLWSELNKLMEVEYTNIKTDPNIKDEINIWPNPAKKELNYTIGLQHQPLTVYLHNKNGQLVYEETYRYPMLQGQIDISNFSDFIYTIRFTSNHKTMVKKFAISNN
jgi:CubicO group peptidase (beta-lactamase class C family)